MRYLSTILASMAFAFALTLAGGTAAFAQVCKGLSKSACQSNDGCSHVGAFTRKDGVRVKSFCRAKPGNGARKSSAKRSAARTTRRSDETATRRTSAKSGSKRRSTSTRKASAERSTATRKSATKRKASKRKTTKRKASSKKRAAVGS